MNPRQWFHYGRRNQEVQKKFVPVTFQDNGVAG